MCVCVCVCVYRQAGRQVGKSNRCADTETFYAHTSVDSHEVLSSTFNLPLRTAGRRSMDRVCTGNRHHRLLSTHSEVQSQPMMPPPLPRLEHWPMVQMQQYVSRWDVQQKTTVNPLSVCLSVCQSVCLSVCLSVFLSFLIRSLARTSC